MALAAFTDAYGKGSGNADRMRASSKVITIMLRNWSGEPSHSLPQVFLSAILYGLSQV